VFIGSMNMDQRSKLLNTEMGVIVDSPALAKAVGDFFDRGAANAFQVELKDGPLGHKQLVWIAQENGETRTFEHEPGASAQRRLETLLLRLLPIDGLL
jgi:putative cardiolipin synthase